MKYTEDENGFVHFDSVPISKAGITQYLGSELPESLGLNPDQIYSVLRPESELNSPETIESFKGMPWFNKHKMVGDGMTPTEQVGAHGSIGDNVRFENGTLFGNLHLFGKSLKESIKQGLKELSCGFKCMYELSSGTHEGKPYQVIQKQIRGNHLASVPNGRMGSGVSVAMDQLTFAIDELEVETNEKGNDMTIEEMIAKVKEAQPAKAELEKLLADITAMLGDGGEPESEAEDMEEDLSIAEDEDEPAEEDKKSDSAMDESAIAKMISEATAPLEAQIKKLKGSAMDERSVMKQINERNALGSKIASVVSGFEYQDKTLSETAKTGVKALSIACDSGAELAALSGYFAAKKQPSFTVDNGNAQDADVKASDKLDEMGL